ncbi:MAG: hypothetical protein ACTS45_00655 [Candidatus Hodgkinia cicadicola]
MTFGSWTEGGMLNEVGGLSCLTAAGTRRSMICLSWLCFFFERRLRFGFRRTN